jgi:hypothetical protein
MKKSIFFWILALLITIGSSIFQRFTGPTYPISGKTEIDGIKIEYNFPRSASTSNDCSISFKINSKEINNLSAFLEWKRFKVNEKWNIEQMNYDNGYFTSSLPVQPSAGKLEYWVKIKSGDKVYTIPEKNVVIRFKDDVPAYALIPHIIFIFLAMFFSTRAGLEYFNQKDYKKFIYPTLLFLILGGLIFGPIVQKFAFGAFWTGIPFGYDLTDNKTLIAFVFWLLPLFYRNKPEKFSKLVLTAAIITLVVFLIPHSLFGSELDYTTNRKINEF